MEALQKTLKDSLDAQKEMNARLTSSTTTLSAAQSTLTESVQTLVTKVDTLATAMQDTQAQLKALRDTADQDRAASRQHVVDAIAAVPDKTAEAFATATAELQKQPALLTKGLPTDLPNTNLGVNHPDWLVRFPAGIRLWSPKAADLLTNRSLSIAPDGAFSLQDIADVDAFDLNATMFNLIQRHISGPARTRLDSKMLEFAADPILNNGIDSDQADALEQSCHPHQLRPPSTCTKFGSILS